MTNEMIIEEMQQAKHEKMKKSIDILAEEKNREFIKKFSDSFYAAMRANKISQERAERILKQVNNIIGLNSDNNNIK